MIEGFQKIEISEEFPVMVALKGNKLGHEIIGQGQSFRLSNIFSQEAQQLGSDKFTSVYFRTQTGNIYRLDEFDYKARLINAKESRKRGSIFSVELSPDVLKKQKIIVGEPFAYYGNQGKTTRIVEIVPATSRVYNPDDLRKMTEGRTNSIIEDFESKLPVRPNSLAP